MILIKWSLRNNQFFFFFIDCCYCGRGYSGDYSTIIAVTQNEPYQEAIGEASEKINEKIQKTKEKMKTLFSKGKKERDKEGNPIPLGNQKQSPLGKGANGGPEM